MSVFYYVFCIVVVVKRRCYEDTLFSRVQASKLIHSFSLAPFFSHHFLILEEIWLAGEGVTTPNAEAYE